MPNKNILLIEPGYRNKYPPLGLMKIAQYHGPLGKRDAVRFIKGEDKSVLDEAWDRIYVTTLFSFEWPRIKRSINFALQAAHGQADKVFVGGIAASLMHEQFLAMPEWRGVRFIKGLLNEAPAISLQLDEFEEELYADDQNGTPIEELVPDYSILDQVDYQYPVHDAYFVYATRGCIRKCSFCGVPTLEGGQRDAASISNVVKQVEALYGVKKDLVLLDNNVVASSRFKEVVAEIIDLGFGKDATMPRNGIYVKRRVDFNQGVDARILAKDPMYMKELARTCISPLRIAFDNFGTRKPYEKAIRDAAMNGLTNLSNYMLYNFHDTPGDLFARMRLNVSLNEELDIRIFSFPMRYLPVNEPNRKYVGENWTRYQLRSLQVILQATHGIVSGAPHFFRQAFGDTEEEFEALLLRPHHFIFNRMWFERGDGRDEFDDYLTAVRKLSNSDKAELLDVLSEILFDTPNGKRLAREQLGEAFKEVKNKRLRDVLRFHIPLEKKAERTIWEAQRAIRKDQAIEELAISNEELVEDAGLSEGADMPQTLPADLANDVELVA